MSLSQWLSEFRDLHERVRRGSIAERDLAIYRKAREELARALLAAQRLTLKPGETPRQALRVARALQVDLDLLTSRERAITIDLSTGGFACLLAKSPPLGDEVGFTMRIPASEPMSGRARIADVKPHAGNVRVAFQFVGMEAAEKERLELFVFDTVLGLLST